MCFFNSESQGWVECLVLYRSNHYAFVFWNFQSILTSTFVTDSNFTDAECFKLIWMCWCHGETPLFLQNHWPSFLCANSKHAAQIKFTKFHAESTRKVNEYIWIERILKLTRPKTRCKIHILQKSFSMNYAQEQSLSPNRIFWPFRPCISIELNQ